MKPSVEKDNVKHPMQSESIFRYMVESVQDYGIFMLDATGVICTWNPGAKRMKQYAAEEIIGKHFSIFYPEEDVDNRKPWRELEGAIAKGRFEDEGWRLRKDGTRFWANVIITKIVDETGRHLGFGKITRDLTERRLADLRYRLLVEGVRDYAIYSLDKDGKVTSWNSGAERIKGYLQDEIIGKHFSSFYTPEDVQGRMPEKVLETARREGHYEGEGWRVRKNGERFWSSVVVTPLRDDEGNLAGYSKVTRDITERKKLLDELQRHAHELEVQVAEREQTNAELEAFSYSVSHDLRAPLRAIEGFSSALKEDYGDRLDATGRDFIEQIAASAVRMNQLVQDLLNYSRVNRIEMSPQRVNLRGAIDKVLKELGQEGASVSIDVGADDYVLAHPATLGQVILNLVGNALKFVAPGKKATVHIATQKMPGGILRTNVVDKGIGISPRHQERIFKVFERLHGQEAYPGTGIGLAIVKRSVERMGGHVGVESVPENGSIFWFDLNDANPTK